MLIFWEQVLRAAHGGLSMPVNGRFCATRTTFVLCKGLQTQPNPKKPSVQQAASKAIGDVVRTTCSAGTYLEVLHN